MSLRQEFVPMALQAGVSMSELCRRFEISRKTGYKWLRRYRAEDLCGLADRSRRLVAVEFSDPENEYLRRPS